jgi:hypothetical protein
MSSVITLNNLLAFVPENDKEREIFNSCKKNILTEYLIDTKSRWGGGQFYLGGFIPMKPDEEITIKIIEEIKVIREKKYIEYGGACNGAELASMWRSERQLGEIEILVKKYNEIYKMRVEVELLKNKKINNDVAGSIVGFI